MLKTQSSLWHTIKRKKIILEFNSIGSGLLNRNSKLLGFEIAGSDKVFVPANAKIVGFMVANQIEKRMPYKRAINKLFKKQWKKVQKESKLKLDEDLMELKLQEKKLLKKEIFLLKQLDLI